MEFEFKGFLEKETFVKAILLAAKDDRKKDIVFLSIGLLIIGGFIVYIFYQHVGLHNITDYSFLKLVLPLAIIEYFLLYPFFSPYVLANKSWKDPSLQKQLSGRVTNQGIEYSGLSTTIEWSSVIEKQSSNELLILLTIDKLIVILPKNYFSSEEEWKKVILLSNYKVNKIH